MTKDFTKAKYVWIRIGDLAVHPKVQRALRPSWARAIRDDFDPDKFGELAVMIEGGRSLVFDGQHRLEAVRELYGCDQKVPCFVHDEMPIARQAEIFLGRNNTRSVRAIDRYRVAVLAEREMESRIEAILGDMDLRVGESRTPGIIRSPAALQKVYQYYGEAVLSRTIGVLRGAWADDPDAYDGVLIRAIGLLIHAFRADLDDTVLCHKLARAGSPTLMVSSARNHARTMSMAVDRACAERALNIYNKNRRQKALSLTAALAGA